MPAARSVDDICVSTMLPTTGLRIKIKKVSSAKLVSLAAEHKRVEEVETLHDHFISAGRKFCENLRLYRKGCQDVHGTFFTRHTSIHVHAWCRCVSLSRAAIC